MSAYQIVAGDDRDLEVVLRDRRGRVIGLEPYESVTVQVDRADSETRLDVSGESYTIASGEREVYESGGIEQGSSLVLEQGGELEITDDGWATLEGTIVDDETVAVDLDGTIDRAGRWELEWELRDGAGRLLRTVPESGTIPVVARQPILGGSLDVESGEAYTVESGERELFESGGIEQGGSAVIEQGGYLKIIGE